MTALYSVLDAEPYYMFEYVERKGHFKCIFVGGRTQWPKVVLGEGMRPWTKFGVSNRHPNSFSIYT